MTNNFFPLPISLSWFIARARWQGAGTCVIALADDWRAYFDHLWGYGYVSPDASLANGRLRGIVWAIWDPPFSEKESKSREYPPPLTTKQQQSIWEIISGPSSKTIPARSSVGMPVKTTEELYTSDLVDSMTVYYLVPLPVDSAFVQNLADGFCMNYGILCVPEMGQDDEGNWWATEDEFALWGDPENGVIQFVNTDEYVAKKSTPPGVPDPGSAILYAQTLLMDLGLDPTGSYSTGYTYNIQTAYDLDLEEIVPDSSFDLSINAEFIRIVEGFPVFGPGGYITATWGEGYGLQHLTRGGWHDLVDPIGQSIIDVTEAIDVLTTTGEDGTIGGIPPICDTLLIDFVELAYYNTNGEYETDILEPIYHFSCYAASEYDTVPCDVYVPALHLPPGGSIDAPPDGSAFAEGDTVTFIGSATGGLPPYTFQWYSSEDGYLGSGDTLSIDNLSIAWKDSVLIAHTITLIVTDFNALTDNVTISVFIGFVRGNANGDAVIDIGDVVYLINYLFTGTSAPDPLEAGDANCDGVVDIGDVIYLINYLFTGTTPPGCY